MNKILQVKIYPCTITKYGYHSLYLDQVFIRLATSLPAHNVLIIVWGGT